MIKISNENKKTCCGCGACLQVCPQNSIAMAEDNEGFLYPNIDKEKCINCNLCESVCPVIMSDSTSIDRKTDTPKALGGWHKSDEIRRDSSSGGAFSLFAIHVINRGGIVYGATMDDTLTVKHIGVENIADLHKLRGSKYVQSNINSVYFEIKEHLQQGRLVLFIGTPCQSAGLASFLGKKYCNLYIMDFICHGVPSPKVFQGYLSYLEEKYNDSITDFKFRLKDKPWRPSGMQMGTAIKFNKGLYLRNFPAFKDPYMNGFLDDAYLRPSCYDCRFKSLPKYYADITIADFWGADQISSDLCDGKGTSLVLIHSSKGNELFEQSKEDFDYREVDFQKSVTRNQSLLKSSVWTQRRQKFFHDYDNMSFKYIILKYMTSFSWGLHKIEKIAWKTMQTIIKKCLVPIFSLLHINWNEEKWDAFFQFIKFAMVGVTNTVMSYLLNISTLFLLRNLGLKYDYIIANITAFSLSVLWSYYWNSKMVFMFIQEKRRSRIRALLKTYISYAFTGLIINNVLSTIWINILEVPKYMAPLMNLPFSLPINFILNKYWAYRKNAGCK